MYSKPHLNLFSHEAEDYQTAEYLAHQMLHLKTRMFGRNYPGCDTDLYNIGLLNLAMDKYTQAKRFLIRALQIQRAKGKRDEVSKILQQLAHLHKREKLDLVLQKAS